MRYVCLIYLDEKELAAMPEAKMNALNARHLEFNDGLLTAGQFIEAEALEPGGAATCVRMRQGKSTVVDGPYAETKEQVAGFYLIEARRSYTKALELARQAPERRFLEWRLAELEK